MQSPLPEAAAGLVARIEKREGSRPRHGRNH